MLGDTVNARVVRILLEWNLVQNQFDYLSFHFFFFAIAIASKVNYDSVMIMKFPLTSSFFAQFDLRTFKYTEEISVKVYEDSQSQPQPGSAIARSLNPKFYVCFSCAARP